MRMFPWWSSRILAILFSLFALLFTLLSSSSSFAQTQQAFLITYEGLDGKITDIAVFVRNDQTGDLTEVPNSPNPGPPPPPAPAVTLNPNPLNFSGTVTVGIVSAASANRCFGQREQR